MPFLLVRRDLSVFTHVLQTNVIGTFAVIQALMPLLRKGHCKQVINVSSDAGCLDQNSGFIHKDVPNDAGMALDYRCSKAALNMSKTSSHHLRLEAHMLIYPLTHTHTHTCTGEESGSRACLAQSAAVTCCVCTTEVSAGSIWSRLRTTCWEHHLTVQGLKCISPCTTCPVGSNSCKCQRHIWQFHPT